MRCAILADIHSNYPALQAVAEDAARMQVDQYWNLGDLIDYGPFPVECIQFARKHIARGAWIVGDHEIGLVDHRLNNNWFNDTAQATLEKTRGILQADARLWNWTRKEFAYRPRRLARFLKVGRGWYYLTHGSVSSPLTEYIYPWSAFAGEFERLDETYVKAGHGAARQRAFLGQTHWPFLVTAERARMPETIQVYATLSTAEAQERREIVKLKEALRERVHDLAERADAPIPLGNGPAYVNPGSVGQPRDGNPDASYAILDTHAQTILFRRVPYRIDRVIQQMRRLDFPNSLIERMVKGL